MLLCQYILYSFNISFAIVNVDIDQKVRKILQRIQSERVKESILPYSLMSFCCVRIGK